jgi:hypothetical protein
MVKLGLPQARDVTFAQLAEMDSLVSAINSAPVEPGYLLVCCVPVVAALAPAGACARGCCHAEVPCLGCLGSACATRSPAAYL